MTIPSFHDFNETKFSAGNLSSNGGFLLLLTALSSFGFFELLNSLTFEDDRKNPSIKNEDIISYKIITRFLGISSDSQRSRLREDPVFAGMCIPSMSSESRLLDRCTDATIQKLSNILMHVTCAFLALQKIVVLDQDSTVSGTKGNQEFAAYIPHYQKVGLHPLLVTERISGLILGAWLRPGNTSAAMGGLEQLLPIIRLIRYYNPNVIIKLRCDSASFNKDFLYELEQLNVLYYIRARNSRRLETCFENELGKHDIDFRDYTHSNPYRGQIQYRIHGSGVSRRICFKAYQGETKSGQIVLIPCFYGVITNDTALSCYSVMRFYEGRGANENINKFFKSDFAGSKLPHKKFLHNELELVISALSYDLFQMFKYFVFNKSDRKMTIKTFRSQLGCIACKVTSHSREKIVNFSSKFLHLDKFKHYMDKVKGLGKGFPFEIDWSHHEEAYRVKNLGLA